MCQLFQTGGMLSVKGSGSIRCELMRQEGGEECEECPCLCRTPFSSLASRGRPERIKASGRPYWPHTTTLPRREEAASTTPTAGDPLPSARRQPPRPTAPETAARRVPTPPPARTRAASPARRATPAPPPPAAHSAPTMSAAGLGPVRCAFVLLLALYSRVSTGDAPRRPGPGGRPGGTPAAPRGVRPADSRLPPQPISGQDCGGRCQCAAGPAPRCPAGVSLVLDSCGCCRVCAKQLGELCTERDPCDPHKGLFCDFGSPANRKIGVCTGKTCSPRPRPAPPPPPPGRRGTLDVPPPLPSRSPSLRKRKPLELRPFLRLFPWSPAPSSHPRRASCSGSRTDA